MIFQTLCFLDNCSWICSCNEKKLDMMRNKKHERICILKDVMRFFPQELSLLLGSSGSFFFIHISQLQRGFFFVEHRGFHKKERSKSFKEGRWVSISSYFGLSHPLGDDALLERMVSTWGAMFGSSALHTQTTALGEGIKQCTVGRTTMVTITTRDWQVSLLRLGYSPTFRSYPTLNQRYLLSYWVKPLPNVARPDGAA